MQLITRQNLEDFGEGMVSAESLRAAWQAPGFDLSQDAWVIENPQGGLAGYAGLAAGEGSRWLSVYLSEPAPEIDFGSLQEPRASEGDEPQEASRLQTDQPRLPKSAPAARLEIGRVLLERAEIRAGAGARLVCRAAGKNPALQQLLEEAGYRLGLTFHIMQIDLASSPQAPRWPEGVAGLIAVRPFRPGQDDQAVYRADEEASQDKGYHSPLSFEDWARRMSLYEGLFDPGLWFLAWDGDEVAGVALNFLSQGRDTGWVDHLAVRRPWRNRGLGMALLLHSFDEFFRIGALRVKLSVDSGSPTDAPRLYLRAGMRVVQKYSIYSKEVGS